MLTSTNRSALVHSSIKNPPGVRYSYSYSKIPESFYVRALTSVEVRIYLNTVILLNKRTELLQKCRHRRKFTYAGFKTRKWNYENPGNPTGTDDDNQR